MAEDVHADPTVHVGKATLKIPVHRGAETFNFFSHLLGIILAIVGLGVLVWRAEGALAVTAYAIYGATLITLFSASTLHHAVQTATGTERSGFLRRFDHVSIFLFIAGTYTPVCLLAISRGWGITILSIVWGLAIVGTLLKIFAPFMPRWVTTGIYIGMGWIAIVGVKPLMDAIALEGLLFLLAGGIVYTVGAVGYAMKKPDVWPEYVGFHGIWHVAVLIAAALHFVFIFGWVPTTS